MLGDRARVNDNPGTIMNIEWHEVLQGAARSALRPFRPSDCSQRRQKPDIAPATLKAKMDGLQSVLKRTKLARQNRRVGQAVGQTANGTRGDYVSGAHSQMSGMPARGKASSTDGSIG
jgi:hypothetical protein